MSKAVVAGVCLLVSVFSFAQQKKYPGLLWEITGKGLQKPSYLFGTMHVSSKMVFHLSDSFYYAIKNVDMVALEQNPFYWQRDMMDMDKNGQQISAYMRNGANNYLRETSFQLQPYEDNIRAALTDAPQVVNSLLYRNYEAQEDYEENTYLDLYIYQTGKKLGKKATGVEDYYQTERIVFEAYQDAAKDRNKHERSTGGETGYELQKKIQAAYRQGDLDVLDSLEKYEFTSPAFVEKFLYKRNEIQAHSIDTILGHNSLFVGVGAAHLPGKRGVIELLRKMGYRLRPVGMQDRNAERKDEIDKLKVPVQFQDVQTEDGFVTMKLPGALYKRSTSLTNTNRSWQYADMENGTYYTLSRVQTNAALLGESMSDVLKRTDSLLYENIPGRIISKSISQQDAYPVINITNRTRRGDLQRYRIIITPFEEVICKMSGNDDYVNGAEADLFFNSIHIDYHPLQWQTCQNNRSGFSSSFPQLPFVYVDKAGDNMISAQWAGIDSVSGNAYTVLKKTVNNYGFLEEDTFDISLIEESLKRSKLIDRELNRSFTKQDGFSALNMLFLLKNGAAMYAKAVLRGAQYYVFMLSGKKKDEIAANSFFSSCRLTPFSYAAAQLYQDTTIHFSVQTPVVPHLDTFLMSMARSNADNQYSHGYDTYRSAYYTTKTAFFQDDTTGEAVLVNMVQYPTYFYSKDSALFWNEVIDSSSFHSFIIKSKQPYQLDKTCTGYKVILQDTNTVRQITYLYLLKHNRLFRVTAISDTINKESAFLKTFLSSFHPDDDKKGTSVFTNKENNFFTDYGSKDSLLHKEADNAVANMKFSCAALPKLSAIIHSFACNEKNYFENKSRFIHELGFVTDSICVGETEEILSTLYRQTSDTAFFQNEILSALARLRTARAYDTLQALLVQDPPVFDNDNDYNEFFDLMSDSLLLAKRMFPGLLQLSAIESYKVPVNHLLQVLVDSGMVKDTVYKTYFSKLYFDAKIEMKKMQNDDERLLHNENENEDDVSIDAMRFGYPSSYSGYQKNGSEELSTYSSLLMPFYDSNASVPVFFQRQLSSKNQSVKLEAAIALTSNKKPVPDSIWRGLAAKDKWRSVLLKRLESIHRKDLFPRSAANQEDIAKSLLLNESSEEKFSYIQLAGKKAISLEGKKGTVYFFKYKLDKSDDWKIGISGLQPVNTKEISSDNKLTKMTTKNLTNDQPVLSQFEKELHEMILSGHESAYRFFSAGRYENFGFDYPDN